MSKRVLDQNWKKAPSGMAQSCLLRRDLELRAPCSEDGSDDIPTYYELEICRLLRCLLSLRCPQAWNCPGMPWKALEYNRIP